MMNYKMTRRKLEGQPGMYVVGHHGRVLQIGHGPDLWKILRRRDRYQVVVCTVITDTAEKAGELARRVRELKGWARRARACRYINRVVASEDMRPHVWVLEGPWVRFGGVTSQPVKKGYVHGNLSTYLVRRMLDLDNQATDRDRNDNFYRARRIGDTSLYELSHVGEEKWCRVTFQVANKRKRNLHARHLLFYPCTYLNSTFTSRSSSAQNQFCFEDLQPPASGHVHFWGRPLYSPVPALRRVPHTQLCAEDIFDCYEEMLKRDPTAEKDKDAAHGHHFGKRKLLVDGRWVSARRLPAGDVAAYFRRGRERFFFVSKKKQKKNSADHDSDQDQDQDKDLDFDDSIHIRTFQKSIIAPLRHIFARREFSIFVLCEAAPQSEQLTLHRLDEETLYGTPYSFRRLPHKQQLMELQRTSQVTAELDLSTFRAVFVFHTQKAGVKTTEVGVTVDGNVFGKVKASQEFSTQMPVEDLP